jgi:hypothetical protein
MASAQQDALVRGWVDEFEWRRAIEAPANKPICARRGEKAEADGKKHQIRMAGSA